MVEIVVLTLYMSALSMARSRSSSQGRMSPERSEPSRVPP